MKKDNIKEEDHQSTLPVGIHHISLWFSGLFSQIRNYDYLGITILGICVVLALALRISLIEYKTADYLKYSKEWYSLIKEQGFHVFQTGFNVDARPQMYLLYLVIRFFPDLDPVAVTKIPSILADFVCAWLTYRIMRLRFSRGPIPILSALAILYAPTVVLNSAMWGQSDSLYTSALIAFVYFFLTKRKPLAALAYGLALAFKPQAIFLSPLLLILFLEKEFSWINLLLIPSVVIIMLAPAWLTGRSISQILSDYAFGVNQYEMLSMHAPNLYSILPAQGKYYDLLLIPGYMAAAAFALLFVYLIHKGHPEFTIERTIELATAILLITPFFLPKMHERYFFPADIVSIIYAFYFPRYYFIPLMISGASFLAYEPFLFGREIVPMPVLTLTMFIALCIVMCNLIAGLDLQSSANEHSGASRDRIN